LVEKRTKGQKNIRIKGKKKKKFQLKLYTYKNGGKYAKAPFRT